MSEQSAIFCGATGFACPKCGLRSTVIDSRSARDGNAIRRRRDCAPCGVRFTTYEMVEDGIEEDAVAARMADLARQRDALKTVILMLVDEQRVSKAEARLRQIVSDAAIGDEGHRWVERMLVSEQRSWEAATAAVNASFLCDITVRELRGRHEAWRAAR